MWNFVIHVQAFDMKKNNQQTEKMEKFKFQKCINNSKRSNLEIIHKYIYYCLKNRIK